MKRIRTCACKGCSNEFKMYKTTDKYCSAGCAYQTRNEKPKKEQKPLKPFSDKRRKESLIYSKKRKVFLEKPENRFCPVVKAANEGLIDPEEIFNNLEFIPKCSYTGEVHHKAGRKGKLLLYVPYWLAVSSVGHKWIHANPSKAYQLNFLIKSTTV